jgi:hypothetical protein
MRQLPSQAQDLPNPSIRPCEGGIYVAMYPNQSIYQGPKIASRYVPSTVSLSVVLCPCVYKTRSQFNFVANPENTLREGSTPPCNSAASCTGGFTAKLQMTTSLAGGLAESRVGGGTLCTKYSQSTSRSLLSETGRKGGTIRNRTGEKPTDLFLMRPSSLGWTIRYPPFALQNQYFLETHNLDSRQVFTLGWG